MEIIPSILTNNPQEVVETLNRLDRVNFEKQNTFERVQIDINDATFLGFKTIEPDVLEKIDTGLKIDFHLMTKNPIDWIEKCIRGQADRIIGQVEYMENQLEFIGKVQELGASVGLAFDIGTPIDKVDETILTSLDVVLLMSYPAGKGGQRFNPDVLKKMKDLGGIRSKDTTPFKICIDGGITIENIGKIKKALVDEAVIGKRIISGDIKSNMESFAKAL